MANSTAASLVEESNAAAGAEKPKQVSHEKQENGNSDEMNERDAKEFADEGGVEEETTGGGDNGTDNGTDDGNTHNEKENET